jgi:hypothetical protein
VGLVSSETTPEVTVFHTPKLITGRHYVEGEPRNVTGWLVSRPNINGLSADSLVPVTLLTSEGERLRDVLVSVVDTLNVKPRTFHRFSDHMLWRVAETNMGGLAERALAELAYRERLALAEKAREQSARLVASQRAAAILMGRV